MWKMTPGGILIESKEELKKRLGRSPDDGDAVVYCSMITRKMATILRMQQAQDIQTDVFTIGKRAQRQTEYNVFGRR
jgi:hypothetical protein